MQGGLLMAKNGRLEPGDNTDNYYRPIVLYSTTVTYLARKEIEIGEKNAK